MNDNNMSEIYNKLKYNIIGCKTRNDALHLLNKYELDKRTHDLMMSYIDARKYEKILDYKKLMGYIDELNKCRYREEAYDIITEASEQTTDLIQIKTFTRIANIKPNKPTITSLKNIRERHKEIYVTKKCPHCGYECRALKNTIYIVCGYKNTGYDWEGCTRDWCFQCEKLLCKSWDVDQLYLPENRLHNMICCKKHATLNGKKYPEDYCNCNDIYICSEWPPK